MDQIPKSASKQQPSSELEHASYGEMVPIQYFDIEEVNESPTLNNFTLPSVNVNPENSLTTREEPISVLAISVITGIAGIVISSIFRLNTDAGFIIGFLLGFIFFGVRLFVLERQTHNTRLKISTNSDQNINISISEHETTITIKTSRNSNDPVSTKEL